MKNINVKSIISSFVAGVKYKMEDFTWLKGAQIFLTIFAMTNMVFNDIYNDALLKLENTISGFVMFLFVLFGIIAWVFSIRIKQGNAKTVVISLLAIVVTIGIAAYLVLIFQTALTTQVSLTAAAAPIVQKGMVFAIVMICGYIASFVAIALTGFKQPKKMY